VRALDADRLKLSDRPMLVETWKGVIPLTYLGAKAGTLFDRCLVNSGQALQPFFAAAENLRNVIKR
jgi:hypothetical protein